MKIKFYCLLLIAAGIFFAACEKDNYPTPSSFLSGAITYKGDSINVSYNDVSFELWESGWGKLTPIEVSVAQNGSYSVLLFDATYKLIIKKGQGPFQSITNQTTNSDTILVNLKGDQKLNIEVLPYFMIKSPKFFLSQNTVTANFQLEKINPAPREIQSASIYISKTSFVDSRTSISTKTIDASQISDFNNVVLSTAIPAIIPSQDYVFARIGVKIRDVEDMIFSPVVQIAAK